MRLFWYDLPNAHRASLVAWIMMLMLSYVDNYRVIQVVIQLQEMTQGANGDGQYVHKRRGIVRWSSTSSMHYP